MIGVKTLRTIDRYLFGAVTLAVGPVVKLLSLGRRPPPVPRKVLLIKLWAIGDSVLALPLLHAIRERFPEAEIDVLCHPSNRPVFANAGPSVSNVLELNARNLAGMFRRYDVCFDTEPYLNLSSLLAACSAGWRAGFRNRFRWLFYHHTVDTHLDRHAVEKYLEMGKPLGISGPARLVPVGCPPRAAEATSALLMESGIREGSPLVGFCASVGNSVKARQWPRESFREVARCLLEGDDGLKVVLFGTGEDTGLNEFIRDGNPRIINLSGKATLEETFCLVRSMKAFLSNDTGPMHVAAAQGIRTLGIFGPSTPVLWGPYGEGNAHIWHGPEVCEYCPCNVPHHGLVPECRLKGERRDICIRTVTVEEVCGALRGMLRSAGPVPAPSASPGRPAGIPSSKRR
jgi:ADP-heptose:LPS heptosyltransferase